MAIVSAGTQQGSSGTVVFSNSNNVTFGMSNSSVVTASYGPLFAASAAGASASAGTVVFSNSNNVSFGMSGSTVTATVSSVASFMRFPLGNFSTGTLQVDSTAGNCQAMRFSVPFAMSATRLDYIGSLTVAGSAGSSTMSVGVYTRSGSTLSLASSTAAAITWDATTTASAVGNYGGQSGYRIRSVALGTFNFTPGEYWIATIHSASGTGDATNVGVTALASIGLATVGIPASGAGRVSAGNVARFAGATTAFPATTNMNNMFVVNPKPVLMFRMYGTY